MTAVAVIYYAGATADSRSVVASLVSDQQPQVNQVKVLDIGKFTTISQDLPPRWVARMAGHRVNELGLQGEITKLGGSYVHVPNFPLTHTPTSQQEEAIAPALESELYTYFRTDSLEEEGMKAARLREKLWEQARRTFSSLFWLLSEAPPDILLIPNGRTSRQKTARVVAESLRIDVGFYEYGRAKPKHYYLGATQPHDRIASQAEVSKYVAKLSPKETSKLADEFLQARTRSSQSTNQYSGAFTEIDSLSAIRNNGLRTAVFFSSSFDEFLAFGDMWRVDYWEYQFQAFDQIMTQLEAEGYALEMRLHPNLANKSRKYFLREVANARALKRKHPRLLLHWHNSSRNSYDLVARADIVIVDHSTIGLEASLMGKPVWVCQATQWDKVADVRRLLQPDHVSAEALSPWNSDKSGAEKFAAYWMLQEKPLQYEREMWASWDTEDPPIVMKLASLLVPNPWSHRFHLIKLAWTQFVNGFCFWPGFSRWALQS